VNLNTRFVLVVVVANRKTKMNKVNTNTLNTVAIMGFYHKRLEILQP